MTSKHSIIGCFTWYSISLGVACSPLATGSGVTATVGEAGSVCCCEGGGAGLAGSSSFWKSASDRSSIMLISASRYARLSACEWRTEASVNSWATISFILFKCWHISVRGIQICFTVCDSYLQHKVMMGNTSREQHSDNNNSSCIHSEVIGNSH